MKFTDGYWMDKPEYQILSALQVYRTQKVGDSLQMLCSTSPIRGRGDTLNHAMITVTLSSPGPDVIRVSIEHFRGKRSNSPMLPLHETEARISIADDEESCSFASGDLTAAVNKKLGAFSISYYYKGRLLTATREKGISYIIRNGTRDSYVKESLHLDVGEKVYGLGERFTACVKNGQSIDMWNGDGGTASDMAYKNIPFYMTNRGYGVLVESAGDVSYEVASEKVMQVQFSLPGEKLVYDIIGGDAPRDILKRYTLLTGRPALPPAWSFGLWLSTSFTTSYDEETVNQFIDGMLERKIPLSVFHFDCFWMRGCSWCDFHWDPAVFPDPRGMLQRLKSRGLRICCWINPYIAQDSPLFMEGKDGRYFLENTNGDVWQTDLWQPGMAIVDMTNPEARRWYTGYLEKLLDMGVDCFKTDFGERIPVRDIVYADGSNAREMHNYYAYLYNKTVFELLERKRGKGEALVFARSASLGSQSFPVHWNGDSSASFASMAETLRSGLSFAQSGFAFWSHDISGFEQTAPADVYKRWSAFGLLCSHSRLHGSGSYRVPWLFDEESCAVLKEFTELKCRLMPYLYGLAVEAHHTGMPMLRAMMMEFSGDIGAEDCETQYMLGDRLLVAPVFREDGRADFYLPEGKWTHLLSGETICGGGWRSAVYDFHSLGLFVRENTILPMGSHEERPDYDYRDGLTLHLYEPQDGSYTVTVPALNGETAATYQLIVCGDAVTVHTDSPLPYQTKLHRAKK